MEGSKDRIRLASEQSDRLCYCGRLWRTIAAGSLAWAGRKVAGVITKSDVHACNYRSLGLMGTLHALS
jgi:hypothetical protein